MAQSGETTVDARALFERFSLACEPDFWRRLNPHLHVNEQADQPAPPASGGRRPSDSAIAASVRRLQTEGWCQSELLGGDPLLGDLLLGIERLRDAGWHPTFAFVYDEFWALATHSALMPLLTAILDPGFQLRLDFWANYVEPGPASRGWPPHQDCPADRLEDDGRPNILNVWIPLTDATLDNGCMYVVPRNHASPDEVALRDESISRGQALKLLHGARAVPAAAGSVMCWGGQILHWGSPSSADASAPRVSVALSFESARQRQAGDPGLERARLGFNARLRAIAAQFLKYQREFSPDAAAAQGLQLAALLDQFVKVRA